MSLKRMKTCLLFKKWSVPLWPPSLLKSFSNVRCVLPLVVSNAQLYDLWMEVENYETFTKLCYSQPASFPLRWWLDKERKKNMQEYLKLSGFDDVEKVRPCLFIPNQFRWKKQRRAFMRLCLLDSETSISSLVISMAAQSIAVNPSARPHSIVSYLVSFKL